MGPENGLQLACSSPVFSADANSVLLLSERIAATMMPGEGCCSYFVDETRYVSLSLSHDYLLLDSTLDNLMPFPEHTLAVLSSSRRTNTKCFCWRVSVFVISFFSTKIPEDNCIFSFIVMYDLLLCKDRDHLCVRERAIAC